MTRKRNFILFVFSLMAALIAAELILRRHPPLMVYMNTRNIVQQTHSEPASDPILFYVPKANFAKPFSNREFNTRVTINSQNMRDRKYALEKPAGIRRVAALGDSFVFGWGVEDDEIFTEVLENRLLKNVEVLNFGVSGYNARQELQRLHEAVPFKPDLVLLFLYGFPEDEELNLEFREGKLYWKFPENKTAWQKLKSFFRRNVYLYSFLGEWKGRLLSKPVPVLPEKGETARNESSLKGLKVLSDFKDLSRQHAFVPAAVFIPHKWDLLDPEIRARDLAEIKRLEDFCRQNGIRFWDLTPELEKEWKESGLFPYFHFDDHWNRRGHEAAANILARRLKQEGLL